MKNQIVSPPITWLGSKSRLVKKITTYFPKHTTFVDVFGGSAAILLGKKPSKVEVYNDINKKLVTLFNVLADRDKTTELIRRLEYTPYGRTEFDFCRDNINIVSDDIEVARMLIVSQRQSHGGFAKSWGTCIDSQASGCSAVVRKFHAGIARLKEVHYRIRRVQIENLSWTEILKKYDRDNTLFYLDPPYIHSTRVDGDYEHELTDAEHKKLVTTLLKISGKAILSGYYHKIYKPLEDSGWERIEIDTVAYCSSMQTKNKRTECLWISPNCKDKLNPLNSPTALNVSNYTKNQLQVYGVHQARVDASTTLIRDAILSLKKLKKKVTKTEVARITGISRVHISRRYEYLFNKN